MLHRRTSSIVTSSLLSSDIIRQQYLQQSVRYYSLLSTAVPTRPHSQYFPQLPLRPRIRPRRPSSSLLLYLNSHLQSPTPLMQTLLRGFNSALSKVGDVLHVNQATLSGAIDVVVVDTPPLREQLLDVPSSAAHDENDGESLVCTPFHVRFGKLQLLRSREKLVSIKVNDVTMSFCMKLSSDGEAYFILPTNQPVEDRDMRASPLLTPRTPGSSTTPSNLRSPSSASDSGLGGSGLDDDQLDLDLNLNIAPYSGTSPPASGDSIVAAIRAAPQLTKEQREELIMHGQELRGEELLHAQAQQHHLDPHATATTGLVAPPTIQRSPRHSTISPPPSLVGSPSATPSSSYYQIGFGSQARPVLEPNSLDIGSSALNAPHSSASNPKRRGWMRSIFGVFGGKGGDNLSISNAALEAEHEAKQAELFEEMQAIAQATATHKTGLEKYEEMLVTPTAFAHSSGGSSSSSTAAASSASMMSPVVTTLEESPALLERQLSAEAKLQSRIDATSTLASQEAFDRALDQVRDGGGSITASASPQSNVADGGYDTDGEGSIRDRASSPLSPSSIGQRSMTASPPMNPLTYSSSSSGGFPKLLGPFPYTPLASEPPIDSDTPLKLSLCLPYLSLSDGVSNEHAFRRSIVSYSSFCSNLSLMTHPHLVILHPASRTIYPAKIGIPMLLAQMAFNKPLTLSNSQVQAMRKNDPTVADAHTSLDASVSVSPTSIATEPSLTVATPSLSLTSSSLPGSPKLTSSTSASSVSALRKPPHHSHSRSLVDGFALSTLAAESAANTFSNTVNQPSPQSQKTPDNSASANRVGWKDWVLRRKPGNVTTNSDGSTSSQIAPNTASPPLTPLTTGSNSPPLSRVGSSTSAAIGASSSSATAASSTTSAPQLPPPSPSISSSRVSGEYDNGATFLHPDGMWFRKTKRPSVRQLTEMNLKYGRNRIVFTVTSSLQGKQSIESSIYLMKSTVRLMISDIDGTITKSDVLGTLMPLLGRDWSHDRVTELFTAIAKNGFQPIYLTSRAIGQANITRAYIRGLKQHGLHLPDGPILMSPDRLFVSFRREVIDRQPQLFKIMALTQLKHLFPAHHNPFYAGFGNRITDVLSYKSVGVPLSKVFIINPAGNIQSVNNKYIKTYAELHDIVDLLFPMRDAYAVEKRQTEEKVHARANHERNHSTMDPEKILQELDQAEKELVTNGELKGQSQGSGPTTASSSSLPTPTSSSSTRPPDHARLPSSTDADVSFNSFQFWRDEIAPIVPKEKKKVSPATISPAATDSPLKATVTPSASAAAVPSSTSATNQLAFASHVDKQVAKGSAEAEEQAAIAEVVVQQEEQKEAAAGAASAAKK